MDRFLNINYYWHLKNVEIVYRNVTNKHGKMFG